MQRNNRPRRRLLRNRSPHRNQPRPSNRRLLQLNSRPLLRRSRNRPNRLSPSPGLPLGKLRISNSRSGNSDYQPVHRRQGHEGPVVWLFEEIMKNGIT